jgi:drug/metabolite transporter (DMT)-like permease
VSAIFLAAVSALVWGSADYCGGRATQRGGALSVTVVSQVFGLPVLALCLLLLPGAFYASDLAWGAVAGVAGAVGIVLLYQSLSTGAMAVAAPITAVTGALLPMVFGLFTEVVPSAVALSGAGCAVVAIGLVSLGPTGGSSRAGLRVIALSLAAGALFGVFFVMLAQTQNDSGMWPLAGARVASVVLGVALITRSKAALRVPGSVIGLVVLCGIGDIAANALYLLAIRDGLLSVVAPVAALYPVSTVLLALALDRERVRAIQIAGLGLAATALVLTAV